MIGTDIERVERFAAMERKAALRILTEAERAYWASRGYAPETLAGLWCAKEAVSKALGCGFAGLSFTDVEIRHRESGQPYAVVARLRAEFDVSVSHGGGLAIAVAVKS